MAKKRLDIFKVLNAASSEDYKFYSRLTEEERKSLSVYLLLLWGFGSAVHNKDIFTLYMLADVANKHLHLHKDHPELLWAVYTASFKEFDGRYKFLKKTAQNAYTKARVALIAELYECSEREAEDMLGIFSEEDFEEMKIILGVEE